MVVHIRKKKNRISTCSSILVAKSRNHEKYNFLSGCVTLRFEFFFFQRGSHFLPVHLQCFFARTLHCVRVRIPHKASTISTFSPRFFSQNPRGVFGNVGALVITTVSHLRSPEFQKQFPFLVREQENFVPRLSHANFVGDRVGLRVGNDVGDRVGLRVGNDVGEDVDLVTQAPVFQ